MKITGTMSYIEVGFEEKTVKIQGEMTVGGFTAYRNSIKNWNPPYEDIEIDTKTKATIISEVEEYTKGSHMVITFA